MDWKKPLNEKTSFWYRMVAIVVLSSIITVSFLPFFSWLGRYGLFVGGIILGGLWGQVWQMYLRESPSKKHYSKKPSFYVIRIIFYTIVFILIVFSVNWLLTT